jgi:SOS response regulatory protein OraA/RecX
MKNKNYSPNAVDNTSTQSKKNNPIPQQTPYLKAILTGAIRLMHSEKWLDDRAAASRYIRESTLMRG